MILILFVVIGLIVLNIYVDQKIKKAYYLSESRRSLLREMIWFLPFVGAIKLKGF